MNRSERRRYAKQVAAGQLDPLGQNSVFVPKAIVTNDGTKYKSYEDWFHAMEDETARKISEKTSDIASSMLYETEIYMTVWNIMAMLIATDKTVGNLKTVQKSYQKIIDTYNEACEYIDEKGVKTCYEEFKAKYGLELEFDEADLNWIDDDGAEVYRRFKIRIGNDNRKEER